VPQPPGPHLVRGAQPGREGGAKSCLTGVSSKRQVATRGRPVVGVRSSSLLRLRPTARGYVLLLVAACTASPAAVAQAAGRAPDPSPSLSAPQPDPYPTPSAPAATPRTSAPTQVPVASFARSSVVGTPVRHSSGGRRKAQPVVTHRAAVKPVRLPTVPAPGLGARVAAALVAAPQQRVSRALALAVALLVLLSAAFVAGAAREVAR
jgi:hypothetical protein